MSDTIYKIEATTDTPLFEMDKTKNHVRIKGVSMPENAFEFYDPIEKITLTAFGDHKGPLELEIEVSYMNSMSNKQLLKLIRQLSSGNIDLNVIWKYTKGDKLMKMKGEEIGVLCPAAKVTIEETN
jgi:hypothetical protein